MNRSLRSFILKVLRRSIVQYFRANMDVAERFESYEDYLDSQLTQTDLNYLEDEEMARQLVELGYRGLGDTIRREVTFPAINAT